MIRGFGSNGSFFKRIRLPFPFLFWTPGLDVISLGLTPGTRPGIISRYDVMVLTRNLIRPMPENIGTIEPREASLKI